MPRKPFDLSTAPGLLTGLFPGPAARQRFSLSADQCFAFDRDGFLAGIDVLDAAQLDAVRASVDAIVADLDRYRPYLYEVERAYTERPGEVVCHFLGGWIVQPALHDLVFHPAATVPAATLLGVRALRFWHDQVFVKPPRHPGVVPWHQDFSYWTRTQPSCHITVNVMLDDADERSGCLWFVPGSHRAGLLPKLPFDAPVEAIRRHLPAGFVWRPVAAPLRAGQATIHHSHTLHGSYANQSDRWRRAAVLNYMGAHVRSADEQPLLAGVPPVQVGQVVQGQHFPIVLAD
jgi:ectoine hydroxylase-related dioxygenase (phytanoyl-CoA dioxygenase family)